jgi:hypothetical protein
MGLLGATVVVRGGKIAWTVRECARFDQETSHASNRESIFTTAEDWCVCEREREIKRKKERARVGGGERRKKESEKGSERKRETHRHTQGGGNEERDRKVFGDSVGRRLDTRLIRPLSQG